MACSLKWPPKLERDEEYEVWKEDLNAWCRITSIEKKKRALAVHLSLSGRARIASSELNKASLEAEDGIDVLLKKLDEVFLVDEGRRKYAAFETLYTIRRKENTSLKDYLSEFEHAYHGVTKQGLQLDDSVLAFMLLASCDLEEREKQLVMSATPEVTYKNMKATLNRIFSKGTGMISGQFIPSVQVKSEPLFVKREEHEDSVGESEEALYVRSTTRRGTRGGRGQHSYSRGRGQRGRRPQGRRQKNPIGNDGRVSRCAICESVYHWAKSCPESYENRGGYDFEQDEPVNLFIGYVDEKHSHDKLDKLVSESKNCAVIDTGCTNSVCGINWLSEYMKELTDYEKTLVKEEGSNSSFTFGNGVSVSSMKKITFPCCIGDMRATITTDVVDCNLPLLMSRASTNRAKMIINCDTHQVKVNGKQKVIDLKISSSGHYLLPLSA